MATIYVETSVDKALQDTAHGIAYGKMKYVQGICGINDTTLLGAVAAAGNFKAGRGGHCSQPSMDYRNYLVAPTEHPDLLAYLILSSRGSLPLPWRDAESEPILWGDIECVQLEVPERLIRMLRHQNRRASASTWTWRLRQAAYDRYAELIAPKSGAVNLSVQHATISLLDEISTQYRARGMRQQRVELLHLARMPPYFTDGREKGLCRGGVRLELAAYQVANRNQYCPTLLGAISSCDDRATRDSLLQFSQLL